MMGQRGIDGVVLSGPTQRRNRLKLRQKVAILSGNEMLPHGPGTEGEGFFPRRFRAVQPGSVFHKKSFRLVIGDPLAQQLHIVFTKFLEILGMGSLIPSTTLSSMAEKSSKPPLPRSPVPGTRPPEQSGLKASRAELQESQRTSGNRHFTCKGRTHSLTGTGTQSKSSNFIRGRARSIC